MSPVFELTPAPESFSWFFGAVIVLLLSIVALTVWVYMKSTNATVRIEGHALTLDAAIYGRSIALSSIKLPEVRAVTIAEGMPLAPKVRTNGIGLPGYRLGWYRLRNGEKALLAMSGTQQAVYLPTTEGYSLLVSLRRPVVFMETLRTAIAAGGVVRARHPVPGTNR